MEINCESCGTELDHVVDKLYCYTCDESYCVWCAKDSKGNHGEDCKCDIDYPF